MNTMTKNTVTETVSTEKVLSKIEKFTNALSKFVSANQIVEVDSTNDGERIWVANADLGTGFHNYTFKMKVESTKTGRDRHVRQVFVDDSTKPIEFAIAKKKMYTIFDRLANGKAGNTSKKSIFDENRVKQIAEDIGKNKANYTVTTNGFEGTIGSDKVVFTMAKKTDKSGREITSRYLKVNGVVIAEGCKLARFGEILNKEPKKGKADLTTQAELDVDGLI